MSHGRKTVLNLIRPLGDSIEFKQITKEDFDDYNFVYKRLRKAHEKFLFTELLMEKVACMNALSDSVTLLLSIKNMIERMLSSGCIKNTEYTKNCVEHCQAIDKLLKLKENCPR
jgi:hypothetical protein